MEGKKCIICGGSTKMIPGMRAMEPTYYHCAECDFIFMDREYLVPPDEEKRLYAKHENTPENEGYVNMFRQFLEQAVVPFWGEISTGLEFGVGPGPVLAMLLREMGIEMDEYDPYFAPEKVFEGKQYDLITSTEVFEHFADPMMEIRRLREHLVDGGYLAVMTQFHQGTERFPKWHYHRDPTHISFYSPKVFQWIAEELGMEVAVMGEKKVCVLKK